MLKICEMNNKMVFMVFFIVFFLVLIIIYIYQMVKKKQYESINKELDEEHEEIIKALDKLIKVSDKNWDERDENDKVKKMVKKLYDNAKKHWDTENYYFCIGFNNKPQGHHDISKEIKEHIKVHEKSINNILSLNDDIENKKMTKKKFVKHVEGIKESIIEHINTLDVRDFDHWVNMKEMSKKLKSREKCEM